MKRILFTQLSIITLNEMTVYIFLNQQIWLDFQRTYNEFIIEPNFMKTFCDKVVCVVLIPSQKKSCRNHWK